MNRNTYWLIFGLVLVASVYYAQRHDIIALYETWRQSEARVDHLQAELAGAELRHDAMQRRVERLDSDPLEIEALIRRTNHAVREGETVYRVILPEERTAP